jgi:hypothetical protein
MPQEPPPSPPRKASLAYAFYAAAIWALVVYSLWGPKPAAHAFALAAAGKTCAR